MTPDDAFITCWMPGKCLLFFKRSCPNYFDDIQYGGRFDGEANCVTQVNTNFMVTGMAMDTTVKYMVPWTLFLSSIGDTVWTTDFGFGLAEKNGPILDMVKVDAGEYLLAGARLYDFELMNLNGLLMRLSFNPTSTNITSELPTKYSLQQNYPNPFNPTTTISYALPEQSTVKLTVFDIRGQEVMELDRAEKQAGNYEVQWSGMDQSGNSVSTGVFFARLQAGEFTQTIKMVYLK